MAFQFLQPTPVNNPAGYKYYPKTWDAARGIVMTDDPTIPRTGPFASRQSPTTSPLLAVQPGITSSAVPLPTTYAGAANQQHQDRAVSPTLSVPQVYPLNVPVGPGVAPVAVPRSNQVAGATAGIFDDFKALGESVSESLKQFHSQFPDWLKQQQQTTAEEEAVASDLYSGEAVNRVGALLADYETKAQAANRKSIADTQRLRSRALLAQGAGASSGIDRAQFAAIADINARAAAQAADRALVSNQWLTGLQQQMAGARASRARQAMTDVTLPISVDTGAFENILRQLAILSPIEQQNLISGLVGPGGFVADTFSGLQGAYLQDLNRLNAIDQNNSAMNLTRAQMQQQAQQTAALKAIATHPDLLELRALTQAGKG